MTTQPTPSEQQVIKDARSGNFTKFWQNGDDAARGSNWGADRTVRSEVIAALCSGSQAGWSVTNKGVNIVGAKITGKLDFFSTRLVSNLALINCYVDTEIDLRETEARSILLNGSYIHGILGDRARINGAFFLRNGFYSKGAIRLPAAQFSSDFDCRSATISNLGGDSLILDGSVISGNLFLTDGFRTDGSIRIVGTIIKNGFECEHATLDLQSQIGQLGTGTIGIAIAADRSFIGGSVYLRNTQVTGTITFHSAQIKGDVYCHGATIRNQKGPALVADGAKISGAVFLCEGMTVEGEIHVLKTEVGADFIVRQATLRNPDGRFLNAEGINIKGTLVLCDFQNVPEGALDLGFARVGVLSDDETAWKATRGLILNGLTYGGIAGGSPMDALTRLRWLRLQIGAFSLQPYEQLIRTFRLAGHDHDAREIAIAKQDARLKSGQLSRSQRLWFYVLRYTIAYGYKPYIALIWALIMIFVGGDILALAARPDVDLFVPAKEAIYLDPHWTGNARQWLPAEYPRLSPLIYAADVFLPVIDFRQKAYWEPNERKRWGYALRVFLIGYELLGWFFTTLAVLGFTGLVKRSED